MESIAILLAIKYRELKINNIISESSGFNTLNEYNTIQLFKQIKIVDKLWIPILLLGILYYESNNKFYCKALCFNLEFVLFLLFVS